MKVSARGIVLYVDLLANDRITWSWGRSFWGQEERWLWDMDTNTLRVFTERQGRVYKLTNFLEVPAFALFLWFRIFWFFCGWHNLCAETCNFASSPLHCIMSASLSQAWKHMWQDGLFSSRCARFLCTCLLRGGRGRMVRRYRRAKTRRITLEQSVVGAALWPSAGELNTNTNTRE